jgi:hypothetical protein
MKQHKESVWPVIYHYLQEAIYDQELPYYSQIKQRELRLLAAAHTNKPQKYYSN